MTYEESYGWVLQGTYVYSTAVIGQRYGYPDFIERCKKEKNEATAKSVTLGSNTLTMYVHSSGHQFYDIADKSKVDAFYNTFGIADFYGIDEANERIFLPRNKYFQQLTADTSKVNNFVRAGVPNIEGGFVPWAYQGSNNNESGAFYSEGTKELSYNAQGTNTGKKVYFDASRSNSIYGNSDTVQPPSSLKLLYYCVGNTVSDTSWVDVVTQVQGGVKELEDKKNLCIEEIESSANSYDNLTNRQITNCITSIPNRIKYTLVDGVLTVLKGSVAVVPYGTEDLTSQFPVGSTFLHGNLKVYDTSWDGSKFFVLAELQSDKKVSQSGTYELTVFISANAGTIVSFSANADGSGDTIPTGTKDFYHTTLNTLKRYSNGAEQSGQFLSYPIMRISMVDSLVADVRDVANCAGYIDKTIWADKGVKGLIANGRNEDKTLKNTEFTTPEVHILNNTTQTGEYYLGFDYYSFQRVAKKEYYYDFENNYNKHANGVWTRAPFISCTMTNGVVSNFEVVKPFRAVDWNDNNLPQVDGQWVYQNTLLLNTDVVTKNVTLDLSSYLPKNNYNYEVLFSGYCYTPSTAKTYVQIRIYTDIIQATVELGRVRCETGVVSHASGNAILPVGTDRKLYVLGDTAWSGNIVLHALGYRRIGKNI